ncbi:hypothetical protein JTE90_007116 [Oedothorax gibbosus]|uniref:Uncharacterized protein n=1 Tax=Oedothorax gibbosus TaxID=931172 RepID=A0AAV6VSM5_9ARAC|nr:hypothetical protein JTE90_007116 [Oedothorax gibbosus]
MQVQGLQNDPKTCENGGVSSGFVQKQDGEVSMMGQDHRKMGIACKRASVYTKTQRRRLFEGRKRLQNKNFRVRKCPQTHLEINMRTCQKFLTPEETPKGSNSSAVFVVVKVEILVFDIVRLLLVRGKAEQLVVGRSINKMTFRLQAFWDGLKIPKL